MKKRLWVRHINSCIFVLCQLWDQQLVSSQSDQYRRLFSGNLGLLPIVFLNWALGGTLVHFWRECPLIVSIHVWTVYISTRFYSTNMVFMPASSFEIKTPRNNHLIDFYCTLQFDTLLLHPLQVLTVNWEKLYKIT